MNNKESTTAARLKQIMMERGLTQADVIKLSEPLCKVHNVKMNKSSLSQYCNGKCEPLQDKIYVLARALDVSEGWLMGYNVPRRRPSDAERFSAFADEFNAQHPYLFPTDEKELLNNYRRLLPDNKKKLKKYASSLLSIQTAEQDLLAAHENPDATGTDEDRRHDVEIVKEDF